MVAILDMTRIDHPSERAPRYKFHTEFPASGVRVVGDTWDDPKVAAAIGASAVAEYRKQDPYGNMGCVLGVTRIDGGYRAVICLYHSNS